MSYVILLTALVVIAGIFVTHLLRKWPRPAKGLRQVRSLADNSHYVLCRWEGHFPWIVRYMSPNITQFGYDADEFEHQRLTLDTILHPDDRERAVSEVDENTHQGMRSFHQEYRILTKEGLTRWIDNHTVIERDALGRVSAYESVLNDITEQRQAELDLRLAAGVFENTADGIIITDAQQRILFVNEAFSQVTGYDKDEVKGQTPAILRSGRHDKAFYTKMWQTVSTHGRWQGEIWNRRRDGTTYAQWLTLSTVRDDAGKIVHYLAVFTDLSQRKQDAAWLHFLSHNDSLTGLANRMCFRERLSEALSRAQRHEHQVLGLLLIDLDHFKTVNDSLGHPLGDSLLQAVAQRLRECVRESDLVARLGGDEFGIMLDPLNHVQDAAAPASKVLQSLADPVLVDGHELYISASVGISCYPTDGNDAETLLKNADIALYRAKEEGRNLYQFFSTEMNERANETLIISNSLRQALERNEFLLEYQPCLDLASKRITSVETLIRWKHPQLGLISPVKFIPIAEETGVIVAIGEWVLRTACAQARGWQKAGLPPLRLAINLSARQFRQPDLAQRIAEILEETGFPANALEVEITESMVMQDPRKTHQILLDLKAMGITVAIDDFGTGYSSLSYLKRFPIDYLKIDQSFVGDIPKDMDDMAITRAIVAMAKSLRLRVIAEGVETDEQHTFLSAEGCEEGQGFLFGRPQSPEDLERLLRDGWR
ncbi:MAG: EAL domain-containing protein [Gammaproteobacteria bacterium]|nr:EAL domain-containing protein [Gammaproteobacteria bacterium]MCP5425120.1 EAL domain-containing protein [Gammaproteobacteria bacterium]MCP5459807.1 EAL domain-containing protein [Gammaproteobacteria bacterium]